METDKNCIKRTDFLESLAYILREAFEGSPEGHPSAFLDRGIGIFGTLNALNAEAASKDFHGTTVAAQTEHTKFYLDRLCELINGRTERVNWEDSWLIETVNEDEWDALRATMKHSYENTLRCVADVTDWEPRRIGMAIGMVAHTAYHLGAIRQMGKSVKN